MSLEADIIESAPLDLTKNHFSRLSTSVNNPDTNESPLLPTSPDQPNLGDYFSPARSTIHSSRDPNRCYRLSCGGWTVLQEWHVNRDRPEYANLPGEDSSDQLPDSSHPGWRGLFAFAYEYLTGMQRLLMSCMEAQGRNGDFRRTC